MSVVRMLVSALLCAGLLACDSNEGVVSVSSDAVSAAANDPATVGAPSNDPSARVVGGTDVPDLRYPWMAAVYFRQPGGANFGQGCGGSLIADRWILSAAHCVVDANSGQVRSADNVAFVLGSSDLGSADRIVRFASRVFVHPQYNARSNRNDMALLEMSQAVNLQPIVLPNTSNPVPVDGELATVAGWGATSEQGGGSRVLQEVDLPIVSTDNCRALYGNLIDGPSMVCAGGQRQDACFGDSGGPLFVARGEQTVQAGVVSFGFGCARPGLPAVYARTSTQFEWINSIVGSLQAFDSSEQPDVVESDDLIVSIRKRNAQDFALESTGGGGNGQNVYLWSYNPQDINQQWVEIDQGDGFFAYRKNETNLCIDAGNGDARRQNVFVSTCRAGNFNQSWLKQAVGDGGFKLIKRSAPEVTIDGRNGGARGQNVQLWNTDNPSQNLQWIITPL